MDAEDIKMPDVPSDELEAEYGFADKVGVEKDLTGDGGCVKTILRLGSGWESPEPGDQVTVHYTGTLTDGTKFDSSRDRDKPFSFELGKGSVIRGWDVGVASMKKGELAQLTLSPAYAYGPAGSPPSIPPEATLVFEVELLAWKSVKDITGDGGVIKTVLAEGKGWQTPKAADEVVLHYTARLVDPPTHPKSAAAAAAAADSAAAGPVVACSPEGGAVFSSVSGLPCSGLAAAVKSMKPEEHVKLLLSPEYAAGLAEVPEGKLLEVEASLAAVHAVTTPLTGVTMKVMTKPDSYSRPNEGSTVKVSVQVTSLDGAVLEPRHEAEWTTDEEQAPDALEACLYQMVEGEHCSITVTDPALLAAPEGAVVGAAVPPGTPAAVYDVTLLAFTSAKEKWQMNNAEKLAAAVSRKEKGNTAYKAGKLYRAVKQYTAAYETANSINERDMAPHPSAGSSGGDAEAAEQQGGLSNAQILAQAKDVKKASSLNLAAAALKQQQWAEAVTQASRVLDVEPGNMKALYRRAQGHMGLAELLEAELDIKAGLLAHPDNADLVALSRKLKVQAREANKKEAKLYGKMFAALGSRAARSSDQGAAGDTAAADAPTAAAAAAAGGEGAAPVQEDSAAAAAAAAPVVENAA